MDELQEHADAAAAVILLQELREAPWNAINSQTYVKAARTIREAKRRGVEPDMTHALAIAKATKAALGTALDALNADINWQGGPEPCS